MFPCLRKLCYPLQLTIFIQSIKIGINHILQVKSLSLIWNLHTGPGNSKSLNQEEKSDFE